MSEFELILDEVIQKMLAEEQNPPLHMLSDPLDPVHGRPGTPQLRMIAWDQMKVLPACTK